MASESAALIPSAGLGILLHRRGIMKLAVRSLLREYLLPPALARLAYGSYITCRDAAVACGSSPSLSRNAKFHSLYAGKRCFVIGNGPSLAKQDLVPLVNEISIVMNRFNRHPLVQRLKPTIFCMGDPGVNVKSIGGLAPFVDKVNASAYFFRTDMKEIVDREGLLDPEKVYYIKMAESLSSGWPHKKHGIDLTRSVPPVQNTSLMAIILALYMGCSPIYLLGMDHDWLGQHSLDSHFYPDSDMHLSSAYAVHWSQYRVLMEMALIVWKTHEILRDYAAGSGTQIYNATAGGYLDVYPRARFENLFPAKRG